MAQSTLIDIGINDDLVNVIRKCNDNFRRLAMNQSKRSDGKVRIEQKRADAALDGAVGEINAALQEALTTIENKFIEVNNKLDEKIAELNELIAELESKIDSEQESQDNTVAALRANIKDLIYGASLSDNNIVLPSGMKVPSGNMNILSPDRNCAILTHDGDKNGDLLTR